MGELGRIAHRLISGGGDHIANPQARASGGACGHHAPHQCTCGLSTAAAAHGIKTNPNHGVADAALTHQLLGDGAGPVDRNGKAKASAWTGAHEGVDPHDRSVGIQKRPS